MKALSFLPARFDFLGLCVIAALAAACSLDTSKLRVSASSGMGGAAGGTGGSGGNGWVTFDVAVSPEREVDILFMIDNSPSMDPKQQALAANFPKMIQVLQNLPDPS
ncbi:MAG: hypothetical protein ABSF35_07120, partial [Polyangia bacterium]